MIQRHTYTPADTLTFQDALSACLDHIDALQETTSILGIVFFIQAVAPSDYGVKDRTIRRALNRHGCLCPTNVLAQASRSEVSMETWTAPTATQVDYLEHEGACYSRCSTRFGELLLAMGLRGTTEQTLKEQVESAFHQLQRVLLNERLGFSDVVRQWNYVPGILETIEHEGKCLQRYQLFNEVREAWYAHHAFAHGYPAATGIGVRTGPFSIDALVMASQPELEVKALANPRQHNAYHYKQHILVGDALRGQQKHPPLFERAKCVATPTRVQVFVSGTAAILGQDTVGLGDVCQQTEVAIHNMAELISPEVTGISKPFVFNGLRVYVKDLNGADAIQAVCQRHFPGTPTVYVQADVCRDNLLMEIEGEAIQVDAP